MNRTGDPFDIKMLHLKENLNADAVKGQIPVNPLVCYQRQSDQLVRQVSSIENRVYQSSTTALCPDSFDSEADFDKSWLMSSTWPETLRVGRSVGIVDIFSGCGGLALGLWEAARAFGRKCNLIGAIDRDPAQAATFRRNFPACDVRVADVTDCFPGSVGEPKSNTEKELSRSWAGVDFVVGGPPCQGHSNLNNVTRRSDDRNLLAIKMARAAEIFEPRFVIVENVPGIERDRHRSIYLLQEQLAKCNEGYDSALIKLRAEDYGVAQTRHRCFLVAWQRGLSSSVSEQSLLNMVTSLRVQSARPVEWAIEDLENVSPTGIFDLTPNASPETISRINYLHDSGDSELPDHLRPDCHRTKPHTYRSVYGRMHAGRPAPTLTTGFPTLGQGRFMHPHLPRMLTPHEAARIQFFPDFFSFGLESRTELSRAIGNAVPPKLGYVIGLALLALTEAPVSSSGGEVPLLG
jgi:DNA (cytosine-5)-methyltransferase 1